MLLPFLYMQECVGRELLTSNGRDELNAHREYNDGFQKNNQGANKFKTFNVKLHYLYLLMLAIKSVRSYYLFSSNKSSKRLYINMSICIIRFQAVLINTKICKKACLPLHDKSHFMHTTTKMGRLLSLFDTLAGILNCSMLNYFF